MHAKSRMEARELERTQAGRIELAERIARLVAEDGCVAAAPGLDLFRYSSPTGPVYAVNEPSFCIIVQGSKELLLGNERYRYDASRYLLVSAGLPVVGRILEGTRDRPYLAVRIGLDPAIVTAVLMETGLLAGRATRAIKAMTVSLLDANLLDSVVRLVRLVDAPRDYTALAPLAIREIVYRLALGEQGGRLCQIALNAGRAHRIAKAIELVRKSYDKPLRIPSLARQLGMSTSGLHHHFKAVTAMSPLQFQKQLRLQEARRLLVAGDFDAATAGYRVGYDDASQFSREYRRFFGEPPIRDVERLRGSQSGPVPRGLRRAFQGTGRATS
jgi:AraC-like DNA-binding protein